jgi:hypothetical protein
LQSGFKIRLSFHNHLAAILEPSLRILAEFIGAY